MPNQGRSRDYNYRVSFEYCWFFPLFRSSLVNLPVVAAAQFDSGCIRQSERVLVYAHYYAWHGAAYAEHRISGSSG